jgi:hypothetical protein
MPTNDPVLDWLLAPDQPSVQYRGLTDLLGLPESDPKVRTARSAIPARGWAAEILAEQNPAGGWGDGATLYGPKYVGTVWRLIVLADLGLTRDHPTVRAACELWFAGEQKDDGGFGPDRSKSSHLCTTGLAAKALVQFGYGGDPRVRRAYEWLVGAADPKGGWSCYGSGRLLDSFEPLPAFAIYPRSKWTAEMTGTVERGAEFFLARELHVQGDRYEPWFRTHYPIHYYYDLLVGLDALTALGHGADPRLDFALTWLTDRRQKDGRWKLDAVHPDVAAGMAEWYEKNPRKRPSPWQVEAPGQPSRLVTLAARRVLARVALARPGKLTAARRGPGTPRAATRGSTAAPRPARRPARTK